MNTKQLRDAALALPEEDRADLAHELLRSLDGGADAGASDAWLLEIQRRADELASGAVQPIDWVEARKRISQRLHERGR